MDQVTSRYCTYATCVFFFIQHKNNMCTDDHILNILAEMFYLSCIYAHVGHKRRALSVVVDVVIIRHGARQEGGVHCSLCAACPMTELGVFIVHSLCVWKPQAPVISGCVLFLCLTTASYIHDVGDCETMKTSTVSESITKRLEINDGVWFKNMFSCQTEGKKTCSESPKRTFKGDMMGMNK